MKTQGRNGDRLAKKLKGGRVSGVEGSRRPRIGHLGADAGKKEGEPQKAR